MSLTLMVNALAGSCTAESVSVPTPALTLVSSNTPVTVNAGTYGQLYVTIRTPSTVPVGNATLIVYVGAVTTSAAVPR